jgi:hypothetical protein
MFVPGYLLGKFFMAYMFRQMKFYLLFLKDIFIFSECSEEVELPENITYYGGTTPGTNSIILFTTIIHKCS